MPQFSIITAVLNRRDTILRALKSVSPRLQGVSEIEHIVIDGGSTDGTLEVLSSWPGLVLVCEPDKNLYDAWNKGIALSTGEIVVLLNSDDELPGGTLTAVARIFSEYPDCDLVSGAVEMITPSWSRDVYACRIDAPKFLTLREQDIVAGITLTNARFLRRSVFQRIGIFDVRFPIVSDRDFLMRTLLGRVVNVSTKQVLYRYHCHDGSLTFSGDRAAIPIALDSLQASRTRLAECSAVPALNSYRRWHAWSSFYASWALLCRGQWRSSSRILLDSTKLDPFWIARVLPILVRHVSERRARRGSPSDSYPLQIE